MLHGEAGEVKTEFKVGAVDSAGAEAGGVIYWHNELPPANAEAVDEHVVEAASCRVPGTLVHSSELWDECYDDLMEKTRARLQQELLRLDGDYAHVLDEIVDSRHDAVTGEGWLYGRFTYMLYRRARN